MTEVHIVVDSQGQGQKAIVAVFGSARQAVDFKFEQVPSRPEFEVHNKFVEVLIIFIIFLLILIMNIVAMGEIPEEKRGSVIEGVLIGNISFFLGTVLLCGVAIIGTNFDVWKEI